MRSDFLGRNRDGVGDGPFLRGAVADDADAVDAQQWSAAEGAVVVLAEYSPHSSQRLVLLRGERAQDFLVDQTHHELEDALAQLEDDIAGEAIGHNHIRSTAMD